MSTQYRRQPQNCLPATQPDYLLMAHLIDETEPYFSMSAPADGLALGAAFKHRETGEVARETVINLPADSRVHLFASEWPGWYFITQYSQFYSRFGCSCRLRFCSHVRALQAREVRS